MAHELPSIDQLRDAAAAQGIHPSDDDLEAVQGFLRVLVPAFAELEQLVPLDMPPAAMFLPIEAP